MTRRWIAYRHGYRYESIFSTVAISSEYKSPVSRHYSARFIEFRWPVTIRFLYPNLAYFEFRVFRFFSPFCYHRCLWQDFQLEIFNRIISCGKLRSHERIEKMADESRFNGKRATPSSSRLRHSFGIEFDRSFVSFLYEITKQRSKLDTNEMRAKM